LLDNEAHTVAVTKSSFYQVQNNRGTLKTFISFNNEKAEVKSK